MKSGALGTANLAGNNRGRPVQWSAGYGSESDLQAPASEPAINSLGRCMPCLCIPRLSKQAIVSEMQRGHQRGLRHVAATAAHSETQLRRHHDSIICPPVTICALSTVNVPLPCRAAHHPAHVRQLTPALRLYRCSMASTAQTSSDCVELLA
jgi:hypothetical protein